MLDLRYVVDHIDEVRAALARRNPQASASLDSIAELAKKRVEIIGAAERKASERNAANKDMAKLPKNSPEFAERRDQLRVLSDEIKELEKNKGVVEERINEALLSVPNIPDEGIPDGESERDNYVVSMWGDIRVYDYLAKTHWELGQELGMLDFERAAKLSGPRFSVLTGFGARLGRAVASLMLDVAFQNGYTEVSLPLLVKGSALFGTGQLPKFEHDLFKTRKSEEDEAYDLYMIPTAEVPLTNLHAGEILDASALPIAYSACTPCFRSEAGSYGKDVRGLIRQHQFDKVELVRICTPEQAAEQHELLTKHAEAVLRRLELRYRKVELCAGDLGFSAKKTYDLEVWLPGMNAYREISSCSNCGDFQARRASIRYRDPETRKPKLVHTINGSGLAIGRTIVAILEQYQNCDGTLTVPRAIQAQLGTDRIPPRRYS
ncbi:MAG: serine--tRNA ligase [Polyangiaceae bacterium]|nr:serine--tRNA ligase [Polyangiaceae bacterium]